MHENRKNMHKTDMHVLNDMALGNESTFIGITEVKATIYKF
jgi:hypothetical protein